MSEMTPYMAGIERNKIKKRYCKITFHNIMKMNTNRLLTRNIK